jgi:hypothetical protein
LSSISIEIGNERFVIENDLLIDIVDHTLIRNLSTSSNIPIPPSIEILGSNCFSRCKSLSSISFESNSQLTRIGSAAFSLSSLRSILIPRTVQILRSKCFAFCESLSSISFESSSQLKYIQSQAFQWVNVEIVIPSTILFVASDAIPASLQIRLENCNSCPEFDHWLDLRKKSIEIDFRRILKFDSDLAAFTAYLIDISLFEEISVECGIGGVLSEIYQRQDDGCLIVVKSINFTESVDCSDIAKEIEEEMNIVHRCITRPIGFVLLSESSGLRELKIVRLFVEGCSLREVILRKPVWWTPTMKSKVVAGIALSLRFMHSFGLIHGNLNSSNILFDETHRIQTTGFGQMYLEGECVRGGDVCEPFDEGWTAEEDVRAFGSLLVEITSGQPLILPRDADSRRIANLRLSMLVSEIIERIQSKNWKRINSLKSIIDILKKNEFQIQAGVDSKEVWEFVRWVEFMEQSSE